ncbi:efflux RND transporter periplasmic adaptor subunit [Geopsychrobacter electrodiphilus]|uniref:efflux RND transporter periplasmic adaptor subunit n=1 Tax=Geopsychrobacter electrodiphilus TaxID=225196 RepID=UPI00036DA6FA|nr:efflux RND transporter periplasmic adaptor subunit [Geopsychrobacter electrodiphilus]
MSENTPKRNHLKWILPILILILALLATRALLKSRRAPEKLVQTDRGLLVKTMPVVLGPQQARVIATGTVKAQYEITLSAEINGRLTWVSQRFVEGGFFGKGDKILEIDSRDYQLALQRAEAELAQAKAALLTEEEQAGIARREWARLDLADKGEPGALVLRQPQLLSAKAAFAAAEAGIQQAQLNLQRTQIRAPFNGRLRSKTVDRGEYIRSGNPLAVLASSNRAEIIVPLPVSDLQWLTIPAAGSKQQGSSCTISLTIDGQRHQWQGNILRSFGEVDQTTRMAKIAIGVDDPYRIKHQHAKEKLPLENGLFVEVAIAGTELGQLASIPRNALREGDLVWLADAKNQLEIRPVHVYRRQQETLLIDRGLTGNERLILTSISGAATGMKLRLANGEKSQ